MSETPEGKNKESIKKVGEFKESEEIEKTKGTGESEEVENRSVEQKLSDSHDNILTKKKIVVVFGAMAIALLLTFVDQTSITVSLPYIADDLNAHDTISWAGTSSLISNTVFMVLFGRFSDIFSRKYIMVSAMIILAFFDLACGLSQTPTQFYIFRGFCGIGNGGITSLTMVIVSDIVSLEDRGKYQGILGAFVGLGNAIGPFIASAFIQHSTWRKFYYTMFPLILSATAVIITLVPYTKPNQTVKEKLKSVDYLGFLTSSISIIFLLIPISGGGSTFTWNGGFVISMIIIGGLFSIFFVLVEYKFAKLPLIPLRLFNNEMSLTLLLTQNFFFGICYYSALYYYPYYFELIKGNSAIITSCYFLALVIPQSLFSIFCGQIISRTKHYWYVLWFGYGVWLIALGLTNLWKVNNNCGINIITLILNGMGVGSIFQPTLVAAQAHSFKKDRATVISTRNVLRSFGGAIGLAISSTIIVNSFNKH
ncbi:hypothetical protein C6P40_003445 [Pichia californica]|uniref:Major facilitator superfamily (MFS) profile domain-containing protein n=1 Tax=Pichia californica TaxID=460514 RepID=A0A9P6WN85_9ASCO|nr:hypothetical protein C6P40_003445 [[Candida] californica]